MTPLPAPATTFAAPAPVRWIWAFVVVLLLAWSGTLWAATPKFPAQNGTRVVDSAGLLPAKVEKELDLKLKDLEDATTDQIIVVTVKSLQGYDIASYGYLLGREWGVGQSGKNTEVKAADGQVFKNNGIILLVAPKEREVRIEVGYGLEPVMTDALSSMIIRNVIVPEFKAGDYQAGIVKGVDAIIAEMAQERAAAIAAFDPYAAQKAAAYESSDTGGGAFGAFMLLVAIMGIPAAIVGFLASLLQKGQGRQYYQDTQWDPQPYRQRSPSVSSFSPSRSSYRPSSPPPPPPPPPARSGGGFRGGGGSFGGGGASGKW